jgi:hypothetical protein
MTCQLDAFKPLKDVTLTAWMCRYAGMPGDELAEDKMSMSVVGIKGAKLV